VNELEKGSGHNRCSQYVTEKDRGSNHKFSEYMIYCYSIPPQKVIPRFRARSAIREAELDAAP
jgi:hypothetical protein